MSVNGIRRPAAADLLALAIRPGSSASLTARISGLSGSASCSSSCMKVRFAMGGLYWRTGQNATRVTGEEARATPTRAAVSGYSWSPRAAHSSDQGQCAGRRSSLAIAAGRARRAAPAQKSSDMGWCYHKYGFHTPSQHPRSARGKREDNQCWNYTGKLLQKPGRRCM